jgi:hypothetical protein
MRRSISRRSVLDAIFALVCGVLAAWALPARGQVPDVSWQPPFVMPAIEELLMRSLTASVAVFAVMLVLRGLLQKWLAPTPSTDLSDALNRIVALAVGMVLGFTVEGIQVAPGVVGNVLAGFVVTAVAVYGRDALVPSLRAAKQVVK